MEVQSIELLGSLKPIIKQIWYTEFSESEDVKRTDLIVPVGCINIVFNFQDNYYLIENNGTLFELPSILITGQLDNVCKVKYGNNLKQIGLVLTPIGFLSLFNKPSPLYKNYFFDGNTKDWNLTDLFQLLSEEDNFENFVTIIKGYINNEFKDVKNLDVLNAIICKIEDTSGNINIKDLASSFNYSDSAFERLFKKYTGITPKAYSNIIKFRHAMEIIEDKNSVLDLYFDQSHFIKSCKKYTGKTPTELINSCEEITLSYMLGKR